MRFVSALVTHPNPWCAGKSRPSGGITLRLLMEEGILEAGEEVLTVEYKGQTTKGTLTEDGRIQCRINGQDQTFESPSAFSIFLKRLINPSRKVGFCTAAWQASLYALQT